MAWDSATASDRRAVTASRVDSSSVFDNECEYKNVVDRPAPGRELGQPFSFSGLVTVTVDSAHWQFAWLAGAAGLATSALQNPPV